MSVRKTKYCSASCRGKRKRRKQEELEKARLRSGVCQVCGEKFTYTYKGTVRLTAQDKCQIRLLNLPTSILIKCSECGKEAWVKRGPLGKSHVDMLKRMPQATSYQNTQDLRAEEKGRSRQIDGLTSGPSIAQGGTMSNLLNRLHADNPGVMQPEA